jgi:predicted nucleic acid-binding protein/GNAT superfamily N-acetyltransferase
LNITFQLINETSPHLEGVLGLWKKNSKTLGFLPNGAFLERAEEEQILVALFEESCIGYILFRATNDKNGATTVIHLCVDQKYRGQSVADKLLGKLKDLTRDYVGIKLSCRQDYVNAVSTWERNGFRRVEERRGRSHKGYLLDVWFYNHRTESPLFSNAALFEGSSLIVAIDTNIFYDLQETSRPHREESLSLLDDWLSDRIKLFATDELWNDIARKTNPTEKRKNLKFAEHFYRLQTIGGEVDKVKDQIRKIFPEKLNSNSESDLRHLAHAVAGGAEFFVTCDEGLLKIREKMESETGIKIMRPSEIVNQVFELSQKSDYQPASLSSSEVIIRRPNQSEVTKLATWFLNQSKGEKKKEFSQLINHLLSNPTTHSIETIFYEGEVPVGLIGLHKTKENIIEVPLLRMRDTKLSPTIARGVIQKLMNTIPPDTESLINISDSSPSDIVVKTLQSSDFTYISSSKNWVKFNTPELVYKKNIHQFIGKLAKKFPENLMQFLSELKTFSSLDEQVDPLRLEQLLSPLKIVDLDVPTYIVPIQAGWAKELFDTGLASQGLFPSEAHLVLNWENIYYNAKKGKIHSPARILWYVSDEKHYSGIKAIRAYSILDNVVIGKPKELYRQFSRLGIYKLKDLMATTNNDPNQNISALKFSHTELFSKPVGYSKVDEILQSIDGKRFMSAGMLPISTKSYGAIYRLGMNL